jgi:polysaccharide chain length determinant protein (PEP-CTERM system associated)
MLPGKKYLPEDYLKILWNRKWFVLIPAVLISAGTVLWTQSLPNRYMAQTTILVIPQRVPEAFVRSTVTADVTERLATITQQILSRTRLERLIEEFNLYPEERKTLIMEDVIERMRRDIRVDVATPRRNQDTSSFTVIYVGPQPRTVMLVTERISQMFVNENMEERSVQADNTSQFLQAQLDDARRRLTEHDQKLEQFRRQHAGRLPSDMQGNLQMMQSTQHQLQANAEAANRDRDRLLAVEGAIADTLATQPPAPVNASADGTMPAGTATQQLEAARTALRGLELRLRPEHPDVVRTKRLIAELEVKAESEALATKVSSSPDAPAGLSQSAIDRLIGMRREAEELRARIESRRREEERLKAQYAAFAGRLEITPTLESELTALMRDYSTIQEQYNVLLRRSEESKIAANLERRQIGEQFRVIDGARMPEKPVEPNRLKMNMMGVGAGFGLGLVIVGLLAYRDTTLHTDEDVVISLSLPVLAVIPAMVTQRERRRHKRRRIALALSASVMSLAVVAAVVAWKMNLLKGWVG